MFSGTLVGSVFDRGLVTRWQWVCAPLLWVVLSLYWDAAGKKTAETSSAESRRSRGVHLFLVNAALLMVLAPLRHMHFVPQSAAIMAGGLATEAAGLCLAIVARRHLGLYWSGEISIKVGHRLIRSGPYAKVRHPIYSGLLAMYAGTALVTGTWLALAGLAMAGIAYGRKIRLEERNLRAAFGAEYEAYRRESWALAPGLF